MIFAVILVETYSVKNLKKKKYDQGHQIIFIVTTELQ